MRNTLLWTLAIASCALIFLASLWWKVYVYQDCRRAGHAQMYCLGRSLE